MTDTQKSEETTEKVYAVWPRLAALVAGVAGSFTYVVSNWAAIEPVLSSPAMVLISMLTLYGLGGLSAYWVVARPLEHRLSITEKSLERMRERERVEAEKTAAREKELGEQITALRVEVAKLQTRLDLISPPIPLISSQSSTN